MPSSLATARSDSPPTPATASCRRASSLISLVSSARARSRAVAARGAAFGGVISGSPPYSLRDQRPETRAVLLTAAVESCSLILAESSDLTRDEGQRNERHRS